jgi:hypothetical protein
MSKKFYRGIRCRQTWPDGMICCRLFMDWGDYRKHLRRHARAA